MDDRRSARRYRPGTRLLAGRASRRRWSARPHHRRRRRLALAGVAAPAFAVAMAVAGGGRAVHLHPQAAATGFLGRIRVLAGDGPGSFAAQARAAQDAAITRTLSYTPYVRVAGAQHRELALTFDDGPGPYTPAIVSVLKREHAPATFFEVGVMERYFHAATSEIVRAGWAIGDHTFSHAPMSRLSPRDQRLQLLWDAAVLGRYGAPFPRLFRPPYGVWSDRTLALLRRYRMLMVLWSADTADYRRPGVAAIVAAALRGAHPGAIILLHDGGGDRSQTVAALPRIIRVLRRRGYRLVTVPELLLDNPAPARQPIPTLSGEAG